MGQHANLPHYQVSMELMGNLISFCLPNRLVNGPKDQLVARRSLHDVKDGLTGEIAPCCHQLDRCMAWEIVKKVTWPVVM
jgi:hypothetical protein